MKGYNSSKDYAAFVTKTLVNNDGEIQRKIMAMFSGAKAVKSRSIATLTACSDLHIWQRWMENVVTHPPVKPLLTFSNIKNKPERLGRQHTILMSEKLRRRT